MVLKLLSSLSAVLAAIYFFYYFADELLEVKTALGSFKGKVLETPLGPKVAVFQGIPYGKYNERFGDPEAFGDIYTGIYYASRPMEACLQQQEEVVAQDTPPLDYSETCLHLNIWTPQPQRSGREVMVYIHGGYFETGSGSERQYDGSILAAYGDVVVVTFNYRLGVFGFFSSSIPGYTVGNMGLKDQQLALKWVRDHIHSFGGDPNKVTLFGESAGATSIAMHLGLPESRRLFQRAILQSSPSVFETYNTVETMNEASRKLLEHFNCETNVVQCLRNVSADYLMKNSYTAGIKWLPVVDGKFLRDTPANLIGDANLDEIQVLIGVNKNEASAFVDKVFRGRVEKDPASAFDEVCNSQAAKSQGAKSAGNICKGYHPVNTSSSVEVAKALGDLIGDRMFVCPSDRLAQLLVNQNAKVHMYHLTYRSAHSKNPEHWGVPHAADIQWVFGAPFRQEASSAYDMNDEKFARTVMDLWLQFSKYGDPVLQSDLEWDHYSNDYPVYLELKRPHCFLHRGESIREKFCTLWS